MEIRVANPADAKAVAELYAPYVTDTPISFETDPPGADEMASRIEKTLRTHPWLVLVSDGRILGYAYAGPFRTRAAYRWSCEVSAYVGGGARRKGVGRALYTRLIHTLRRQNVAAAFAGITLPNPASVGFHESVGFAPIGIYPRAGFKFGTWYDVGWWGLTLAELGPAPPEPIRFSALDQDERWPVPTDGPPPGENAD